MGNLVERFAWNGRPVTPSILEEAITHQSECNCAYQNGNLVAVKEVIRQSQYGEQRKADCEDVGSGVCFECRVHSEMFGEC